MGNRKTTPIMQQAGHFSGLVANLEAARERARIPYEEIIPFLAGNESVQVMDGLIQLVHLNWKAKYTAPLVQIVEPDDGITILDAPSAHVSGSIPSFAELKKRFPQYVNEEYRDAAFARIPERPPDVVLVPHELPFKYVRFNRRMSDSEMVAAMLRHGLLPALPEEALDFLKEHPEELKLGRAIWALGAHLKDGRVLIAWRRGSGRELLLDRTHSDWGEGSLFLAVPQGAIGLLEPLPSA